MPEEVLGKCSGCGESVLKGDDTTDKFDALWHPRCLKTRRKENKESGSNNDNIFGNESNSGDDMLGMKGSQDKVNLFTGEPLK